MRSPCSRGLKASWSSTPAIWVARPWSLAKDWRTDKMLRQLEALLIVADPKQTFLLSGTGDVIDPDEGIATIGSGGSYALGQRARADGKHQT